MRKPNINCHKGDFFFHNSQLTEFCIAHEKFSAVRVGQYEVILKMILSNLIVGLPSKFSNIWQIPFEKFIKRKFEI